MRLCAANDKGMKAIDLTGNEIAQTIIGNAGENVLNGKEGRDSLKGLGGSDTFVFDTALSAVNIDNLSDFNPDEDKIWLDDDIFEALGGVAASDADGKVGLDAAAFYASKKGVAHDADDRILHDIRSGDLLYDADGTGSIAAVQFADLKGGLTLSAANFFLVA